MESLSSQGLPEIVRESRLHTTFDTSRGQSYTIHTSSANRARIHQTREIWLHMQHLGRGGQGTVDLQKRDEDGPPRFRAVKTIRLPRDHFLQRGSSFIRELEAISKFSQARYAKLFVKSHGWYTSPDQIHIAMEYCPLGDLQNYLRNSKNCPKHRLPEDQVHAITLQVLAAVAMMHEERFSHRDLKPAACFLSPSTNILIVSQPPSPWRVKLSDFGICKQLEETAETTAALGTPGFVAPELQGYFGNPRAADLYAVDMWCLGETAFRALVGRSTFRNLAELANYCGSGYFPQDDLKMLNVSDDAIDFLSSLIVPNPKKRLTAEAAFGHTWIETAPRTKRNAGNWETKVELLPNPVQQPVFGAAVLVEDDTHDQNRPESGSWSTRLDVDNTPTTPASNSLFEAAPATTTNGTQASGAWSTGLNVNNSPMMPGAWKTRLDADNTPTIPASNSLFEAAPITASSTQASGAWSTRLDADGTPAISASDSPFEATSTSTGSTQASGTWSTRMSLGEITPTTPASVSSFEAPYRPFATPKSPPAPGSRPNQLGDKTPTTPPRKAALPVVRTPSNGGQSFGASPIVRSRSTGAKPSVASPPARLPSHRAARSQGNGAQFFAASPPAQSRSDRAAQSPNNDTQSFAAWTTQFDTLQPINSSLERSSSSRSARHDRMQWPGTQSPEQVTVIPAAPIVPKQDPITASDLTGRLDPFLGGAHELVPKPSRYLMPSISQNFITSESVFPDQENVLGFRDMALGQELVQQKRYKEAVELFGRLVELRRLALGKSDPHTVDALVWVGDMQYKLKKYPEAESTYREVFEAKTLSLGEANTETLNALQTLACAQYKQNKYVEAEQSARWLLLHRTTLLGRSDASTIDALRFLGDTQYELKKYDEAEANGRELVNLLKASRGKSTIETVLALRFVADCHRKQKRYAKAAVEYQHVAKLRMDISGPDDVDATDHLHWAAELEYLQKDYPEAERGYKVVIERRTKQLGKDHTLVSVAMLRLAKILDMQHKYPEANLTFRDVIDINSRLLGRDHKETIIALAAYANSLFDQQRYQPANGVFQEVVELAARVLGPRHPTTIASKKSYADSLVCDGLLTSARDLYEEVIELKENVLGGGHEETLKVKADLADLLLMGLDRQRARVLLKEISVMQTVGLGPQHPDTLATLDKLKKAGRWRQWV